MFALFKVGRFYSLAEFRAEWAAYFSCVDYRFGLPTEWVVRGRGEYVVPREARVFRTDYVMHRGRFPMTWEQIRERAQRRGVDPYAIDPSPESIVMVEVWQDGGDDGHVDYALDGYRFEPESALKRMCDHRGAPWCVFDSYSRDQED